MATSTTPTTSHLAALGIHKLAGELHVRRHTVKNLRKLGFAEEFIVNSMSELDKQIRATGEGQVLMADFRSGPFGPMAIVETS